MSPAMIPSACNMLETAVAKGEVSPEVARELITILNPAYMQPARTLLRRDAPTMTSAPNDATVVMSQNSNSPAPATQTHDPTVLMSAAAAPEATVAMTQSSSTTYEATEIISKSGKTSVPTPDKTVVMNAPANAVSAPLVEKTIPMQSSTRAEEPTRLTQPRMQASEGTMQRANLSAAEEKTQRITTANIAEPAPEKTQRIVPPVEASPSPEKTQRIQTPPSAPEKTQRIQYGSELLLEVSSAAPEASGMEPSGLDFDFGVSPDKTQRIVPPNKTKPSDSRMGTHERMATDGPLPPNIDMGPVPFGPGTVIKERFLLKEQIGSGGMGVVYSAIDRRKTEARDPNPLVAIKILGADFARHPKSLIALQREARKAQELAHPNVVTVFDFDREGDAVYMTMELLQGRSLDGFVREVRGKGVSREMAWPIIRGVAEGLAYAHRKGLVHSDLKPANIFLVEDNVPKLLDFGIARAVPSRVSKQAVKDIFDAGSLGAYTVPYATEEMVAGGEPHPADDIYALGLIAYELLGGVHPYKRQGAPEARKLGMKPAPIKGLPRREWKTIEAAISFDRAKRPQDADAFLKALRGITKLQQGLMVATLLLATTAGYFAYSSYRESGPEIPFTSLPTATQQQFNSYMADGDELWEFYVKDKNILALQEAVEQYAAAYDLHPRNRDAVKALKRAADAALDATHDNPEQQKEFAKSLIERSAFLAKDYPPMRQFID
jgi:hypothetical protein